jgi:hypothetical protein
MAVQKWKVSSKKGKLKPSFSFERLHLKTEDQTALECLPSSKESSHGEVRSMP